MLIEPIGGTRSMIAKLSGLVAAMAVVGSFVVAGASATGATDPETQRILAPTGKLRVGLYPGTPTSILPDAQSGGPRGVGYDLGRKSRRAACHRDSERQGSGQGVCGEIHRGREVGRFGQSGDCACRVARGDDVGLEITRRPAHYLSRELRACPARGELILCWFCSGSSASLV
jgi:hypothetical protein